MTSRTSDRRAIARTSAIAAGVVAAALGVAISATTATAAPKGGELDPGARAVICHTGNGSGGGELVLIEPNAASWPGGHGQHAWDIIPPLAGYAGKNWTEAGQAIWYNGCQLPEGVTWPPTTDEPTAPATDQPTAPATDQPTTPATDQPTAPATDEPTAPATDEPTTPATDQPTAPATDQPTAPATDEPTAPATDQPTAPATDEPTTPATDQPTAPATDEPTTTPVSDEPAVSTVVLASEDPSEPADPADPAPRTVVLAATGSDTAPLALGAVAVLALGTGALVLSLRERRRAPAAVDTD